MHTISYLYKLCPRCSALFAAWSVASFSLYLLHLSLSPALFILVWQMNLGQKLWKLKWVRYQSRAITARTWTFAQWWSRKKREKKKQPRSCHKTFRTSPLLVAKVEATKGQRWQQRGKGLPPIRNAHIQLVIWIAVLFPFPHRRAAYATRSTNNSLLPTSNSFNWTCCLALLPLSISLSLFILSFSIFGAHLQARPDNNKRDTKNVTQDLRRFW